MSDSADSVSELGADRASDHDSLKYVRARRHLLLLRVWCEPFRFSALLATPFQRLQPTRPARKSPFAY